MDKTSLAPGTGASAGLAEPVPLAPEASDAERPDAVLEPESVSENPPDLPPEDALCCEISLDVFNCEVQDEMSLWQVLEECATVNAKPGQKRRVEVNFRKLGIDDLLECIVNMECPSSYSSFEHLQHEKACLHQGSSKDPAKLRRSISSKKKVCPLHF